MVPNLRLLSLQGIKPMEEPEHGVRIIASGAVDKDVIEAVEAFITLQRKKLGIDTKDTE